MPLTPIRVEAAFGLPRAPWRGSAALLFRQAAYFSDGRAPMLLVTARSLDASPAGLRLSSEAPALDLGLGEGSRLEFDGLRWLLDGRLLEVDPASAEKEEPGLPSLPLIAPSGTLSSRIEALLPGLPIDKEWSWLLSAALALARLPPPSLPTVRLAVALLGRGSGSTPTGDDFLAGWLLGLSRQGHDDLPVHRALAGRLFETCRLSRHFLHHALHGRFHRALVDLARLPGLPGQDHPRARALLAQGDRSGRATLAGYLTGIHQGA